MPRRKKAKTSSDEIKHDEVKQEPEAASDTKLGTLDFIVAGVTVCIVISVLLKMLEPLFFWHENYDDSL